MKYLVTAHTWNPEVSYYSWDTEHKWANYNHNETVEFTIEAANLDEAYVKFMTEHPEYGVGCGIRCLENSDFLFDADLDYYVSLYGTADVSEIVRKNIEMAKEQRNVTV